MVSFKRLTITDDSGFLALVNASTYRCFIGENWDFTQLLNRFVEEMNNGNLIVWNTGSEGNWTVNFLDQPSGKKSFREFSNSMQVTDGKLFLTNFEDLSMAAQYNTETIPNPQNADLFVQIPNGRCNITVRQLKDPNNHQIINDVDFEVIVTADTTTAIQKIEKIFWSV